jgi:hypothetical protein
LSPRVLSIGGRLGYEDDAETPNTLIAFHDYKKAPLIFEVRGLPEKTGSKNMDKYKGGRIGIVVECEGGYVLVPSYNEAVVFDKDGQEIKRFKEEKVNEDDHFGNFIKAVRSRNEGDLNAPIHEGHLSSALCHTANISYRLGSQTPAAAVREQIKGDPDALPTFERMTEHLAANNVDLEKTAVTLGMVLNMNPGNQKFIKAKNANELLARGPREPFVLRLS